MVPKAYAGILVIVLIGISFGQTRGAPPKTVSISGRVKAAVTEEFIKDAAVSLVIPDELKEIAATLTGKDGAFRFAAVPPQIYELVIRVPGFKIFRKTIDTANGRSVETGDLYMELDPGDVIDVPAIPQTPADLQRQFDKAERRIDPGSYLHSGNHA
jgi:hypothetical protein